MSARRDDETASASRDAKVESACRDANAASTKIAARNIPLCLMAKAPRAGEVKTRMQPQLAPVQSAALALLMLRQTAATARRHWPGEVTLCAWPDGDDPALAAIADAHRLAVVRQADADLGARMLQALRPGVARAGAAAVIGCDVPHCAGSVLAAAHASLARGENPFGAASDGGFY
ncbi:MAG: TIGR04282 family arsenosugar biosynthesis glycosyltransferase, partial [bacterium]